jgi:hypothetical protein
MPRSIRADQRHVAVALRIRSSGSPPVEPIARWCSTERAWASYCTVADEIYLPIIILT